MTHVVISSTNESRELITSPKFRKVDKLGRISVGIKHAGKEVLILAAKPRMPDDKLDFKE